VRLALRGLSLAALDPFGTDLDDIRLEVRSGEIVGLAGISGNGQQELLRALSGEILLAQADVLQLDGRPAGRLRPAQRRRLGMTFVPEDRLGRGAVPELSLAANALLTGHGAQMTRNGLIRFGQVREFARRVIAQFQVKCAGERTLAGSLSGGNLQRFIVGREILLEPRVMVVAQPTWGVDIGAAMMIRQAIIDLRDQGVAVLVVSEELEELFMMSDRIAVIAEGRLSQTVPLAQTNIQQIGHWMGGGFTSAPQDDAAVHLAH
jgi:simple sugar transport system ATP-binding protein